MAFRFLNLDVTPDDPVSPTRSSQVRISTLLLWSAVAGMFTAGLIAILLVFAGTENFWLAIAFSAYGLVIAIPVGLVSGLMSIGAGLGLRWLVGRATANAVLSGIAGMAGVLVTGVGIAIAITYGAIRELEPFVWVAFVVALIGGIGLFLSTREGTHDQGE